MRIRYIILGAVAALGAAAFLLWPRSKPEKPSAPETGAREGKTVEVVRAPEPSAEPAPVSKENSEPPKAPAEAEITATDAEVEALLGKAEPGWRKYPAERKDRTWRVVKGLIITNKRVAAGVEVITETPTGRKMIADPLAGAKPVGRPEELATFVSSKNTPGAYLAAAGASRDAEWLDKGLLRFPNDPTLLKGRALFNGGYGDDPGMLNAWRQSQPDSAWPDILEAELALENKEPKRAYELIAGALDKTVDFGTFPEIGELLTSLGVPKPSEYQWNFLDIGDDGAVISRLAMALRAAEKKSAEGDPERPYCGGAILALYDAQAESPNTEHAGMAAEAALDTLKTIGENDSAQFLGGRTYEEAMQGYIDVINSTKGQIGEARSHLAALPSAAEKAGFQKLWNVYGASRALEMARNGSK